MKGVQKVEIEKTKMPLGMIGLLAGLGAQVGILIITLVPFIKNSAFEDVIGIVSLVAALIGYVLTKGKAVSFIFKLATSIGKFGWLILPFPADIFTGLFCTVSAILFGLLGLLYLPGVFILIAYIKCRN